MASNAPQTDQVDAQLADALPPEYTELDEAPRSFSIIGSFVHTPSGPRYQLSSALGQASRSLKVRRLRPKEIQQVSSNASAPLAFDKDGGLYSIDDAVFENSYAIKGLRRGTLPGTISFTSGLTRLKVMHQPKKDGAKSTLYEIKKNKNGCLEWLSSDGSLVATDFTTKEVDGTDIPVLQLSQPLDPLLRDALVACWVSRLWKHAESLKPRESRASKVKRRLLLGQEISYGPVFKFAPEN